MLIKIETPVSLEIKELSDLTKLRSFMEDNNLKLNKSAIARELTSKNLNLAYYKAAVSGASSIESSDAGFVKYSR